MCVYIYIYIYTRTHACVCSRPFCTPSLSLPGRRLLPVFSRSRTRQNRLELGFITRLFNVSGLGVQGYQNMQYRTSTQSTAGRIGRNRLVISTQRAVHCRHIVSFFRSNLRV